MGDKGETSVNSCGPRHPEWETSVGDKCGRQVWETSVADKWETSVNSCAPRHPEWETRVGDKCGRQVQNHAAQDTQSERQVRETRGRQV